MAEEDYARCRFSVSCQTVDAGVLHCLRGLAQHAEGSPIPKNISWGGTCETAWRAAGNVMTVRFTNADYRSFFIAEAGRLLPAVSWRVVATSDIDPDTRRR